MFHIVILSESTDFLSAIRTSLRQQRNKWEIDFVADLSQVEERLNEKTALLFSDWDDSASRKRISGELSTRFPQLSTAYFGFGDRRKDSGSNRKHSISDTPSRVFFSDGNMERLTRSLVEYAELRFLMPKGSFVNQWVVQGSLPVKIPSMSAQLFNIAGRSQGGVEQASEILRMDPELSRSIQQFAFASEVEGQQRRSIEDSVDRLGLWQVFGISLVYELFQKLVGDSRMGTSDVPSDLSVQLNAFLHHSVSVSRLTREISGLLPTEQIHKGNLELSALLHDLGKFVLLNVSGEKEYSIVRDVAQQCALHLWQAEKLVWNVCHCEIGALMLDRMGLPLDIVKAVLFHHQPKRDQNAEQDSAILVHFADAIDHFRRKKDEARFMGSIDLNLIKKLKWDDQLENWKRLVLQKKDGVMG